MELTMKAWAWLLIAVVILEGTTLFYMSYAIYAGILTVGPFIPLMTVQLLGAFYMMFGHREKRALLGGIVFSLLFVTFLLIAIPPYTYNDAQEIVKEHNDGQLELYSLEHKTVPTEENHAWFLNNRGYYIAMKSDENKQPIQYYIVSPIEGEPVKMGEPYW